MLPFISLISLLITLFFLAVSGLAFPLWGAIHHFLGTRLPVVPLLIVLGLLFAGYVVRTWRGRRPHWGHMLAMLAADAVMVALLNTLLTELGPERVVIIRSAKTYLPGALLVLAVLALIWYSPQWKPFSNPYYRSMPLAGLALAVMVGLNLPWRMQMTTPPAVFRHQDGLVIAWGTNLPASAWLEYGSSPALGSTLTNQFGGLLNIGDRIQKVFLPYDLSPSGQYFQAWSEGIRSYNLSNVSKAGAAASDTFQVNLPAHGDDLFIVSFSDLHDQVALFHRLASHLPWDEVDEALFIGDLMSYTTGPAETAASILSLSTGSRVVPRVFVRGNHESRGQGAGSLDEWLLPRGGAWYYSYTSGDVFFVVLDSGEDKVDSHPEYAGLVDFAAYHRQQAAWLKDVFASPEYRQAAYQVVLVHIPPFIHPERNPGDFTPPEFDPVLDLLTAQPDIDLVISGHIHEAGIWLPEATGFPHPVATSGGSSGSNMACLTAHFSQGGIDVSVVTVDGVVQERGLILGK